MTTYDHYHRHYDNTSYAHVQTAFVRDVFGDATADSPTALWNALGQEPVHTLLNVVTDAALHVSGVSGHDGALTSLVRLILQHNLSDSTIQAMADHLRKFEHPGDVAVDDMLNTLTTIRVARTAVTALNEATRSAADIHSKEGRATYHLLIAAYALTLSATVLLKEGDNGYMGEKWSIGIAHLDCAKHELGE